MADAALRLGRVDLPDTRPALIGERINAEGSRRVKRLLLARDFDGIAAVAREQIDAGAHLLDVCVAMHGASGEAELMTATIRALTAIVDTPLVIDTRDPDVAAAALPHVARGAVVNSVSLERGRAQVDAVLPLAQRYGASVTLLCIDEEGMARTCARKVAVATRLYEIAVREHQVAPARLLIDPLTFALGSGREPADAAVQTLEALRVIKAVLPGVQTLLGISDISYGLAPGARAVLNASFLHHASLAGLDMAIVNVAAIRNAAALPPAARVLADDVVLHRREDALSRFAALWEPAAGPP